VLFLREKKIDLVFNIFVDNSIVSKLNENDATKVDDVCILHLKNGKDLFISISFEWERTFFGYSLTKLVCWDKPVRNSTPQKDQILLIPKELWRMSDYVFRKGLHENGIFLTSGGKDINRVIECLDTGESFACYNISVHSVAETMILWLNSLPSSVIPQEFFTQTITEGISSPQGAIALLSRLPPAHYNVFCYLVSLLRELLTHKQDNTLSADTLSGIFASVIIKSNDKVPLNEAMKRNIFSPEMFILEPNATNCYENAMLSKKIIFEKFGGFERFDNILFVAKSFMTRRCEMSSSSLGYPMEKIHYYGLVDEKGRNIGKNNWWLSNDATIRVLAEVERIGKYAQKGDLSIF